MKVVFLKNNKFIEFSLYGLDGYKFNPRNKDISLLNIVDEDIIKFVLSKKIKREIDKTKRTIKLIVNSNVTILSDCEMMESELYKITKKLDYKYRKYFNEFEYFERVKELYVLYHLIKYKKKIL